MEHVTVTQHPHAQPRLTARQHIRLQLITAAINASGTCTERNLEWARAYEAWVMEEAV